jgi:hypothetical protein
MAFYSKYCVRYGAIQLQYIAVSFKFALYLRLRPVELSQRDHGAVALSLSCPTEF